MIQKTLGIFDSGLGGLTVVRELRKTLPGTHLIYLGDTARLPYGTKSDETIRRYIDEGCRFLKTKGVDGIVLACNTMSSLIPASHFFGDTPIFGVIAPVVRAALREPSVKSVGILGTPATIASGAYEAAIHSLRAEVKIHAVPAPLLVPLVEEGWLDDDVTRSVIRRYLFPLLSRDIDRLILGCTHYPILMDSFRLVLAEMGQEQVEILENSIPISQDLVADWSNLEKQNPNLLGNLSIYVTDAPRRFLEVAQRFLGEPVPGVQHVHEL